MQKGVGKIPPPCALWCPDGLFGVTLAAPVLGAAPVPKAPALVHG